jgi:preprotein translocase subunit SecE
MKEAGKSSPQDMTFQIAVLVALIGTALLFFAFDWVSANVVSGP